MLLVWSSAHLPSEERTHWIGGPERGNLESEAYKVWAYDVRPRIGDPFALCVLETLKLILRNTYINLSF